jgi:hypothetical protein
LILCTGKRRLALTHDDLPNMPPDDDEETGFETSAELRHGDTFDIPEPAPPPPPKRRLVRPGTMLAVGAVTLLILVVLVVYFLR